MSTKTKIFEKNFISEAKMMEFGQKTKNLLRSLAQLPISNRKSSINLCKSEFRHKIKRAPKRKFFKKCHFGVRNYGIWLKNDKPLMESYSLTHFQSKSYTNLCESEFQSKTKPNTKNFFFLKDAIPEAEMMEFGRKKINLVWSLAH